VCLCLWVGESERERERERLGREGGKKMRREECVWVVCVCVFCVSEKKMMAYFSITQSHTKNPKPLKMRSYHLGSRRRRSHTGCTNAK
jgi:hypothetical protein